MQLGEAAAVAATARACAGSGCHPRASTGHASLLRVQHGPVEGGARERCHRQGHPRRVARHVAAQSAAAA
eukprot:5502949-Pleurochrysis_carterae.AAC.2